MAEKTYEIKTQTGNQTVKANSLKEALQEHGATTGWRVYRRVVAVFGRVNG